MKQRLKRKTLTPLLGILLVLALVAGAVLFSAIVFVAAAALRAFGIDAGFMQYVQYALFIVIGVLFVRGYMTEYVYAVDSDEITVERCIGARSRPVLHVKLTDIVSVDTRRPDLKGVQRLTFMTRNSGGVYITYSENGLQKCAYLSLDDGMRAYLEQRMKLNDERNDDADKKRDA